MSDNQFHQQHIEQSQLAYKNIRLAALHAAMGGNEHAPASHIVERAAAFMAFIDHTPQEN